jgi:hypothetical protein
VAISRTTSRFLEWLRHPLGGDPQKSLPHEVTHWTARAMAKAIVVSMDWRPGAGGPNAGEALLDRISS